MTKPKNIKILLNNINLLIILPLLFIKSWKFLLEPRLWAEEGSIYLKSVLDNGLESVFKAQQGYYSVIPNVVIYFSSLFDAEFIPYFTVYFSLFVWILFFLLLNNINNHYKEKDYVIRFSLGLAIFFVLFTCQEIF